MLAVTGGKGGIGKSSVASVLALVLQREGLRTALLDLDLTAPSDHVILGAEDCVPTEEHGVEPPRVDGIELMSVAWFLKEHAAPLRGDDVTNALLEILAVTRWQPADVLVVDMPPGLGDVALDAVRWLPNAEYLVVAGSSRVVPATVRRTLRLLTGLSLPVVGVVENMARGESEAVPSVASEFGVPWLGTLLALVNLAFAAAIGSRPRIAEGHGVVASACLIGASLFMPAGFLLGGVVIHGGDPGLGIALLPIGAILLIAALALVARSMWAR